MLRTTKHRRKNEFSFEQSEKLVVNNPWTGFLSGTIRRRCKNELFFLRLNNSKTSRKIVSKFATNDTKTRFFFVRKSQKFVVNNSRTRQERTILTRKSFSQLKTKLYKVSFRSLNNSTDAFLFFFLFVCSNDRKNLSQKRFANSSRAGNVRRRETSLSFV